MLLSFSFCGIFSFDQVGVTFRYETLVGSELPQYAAHLDHFLKATEQRFLRLSCMQSYLKRHIEPSFSFLSANINKAKGTGEKPAVTHYDRVAPEGNTNSMTRSYFYKDL